MKKILFFFLIFFTSVSTARAHAPSKIELQYDKDAKKLHISVTHIKKNNSKHFIRWIYVYLNGKEVDAIFGYNQISKTGVGKEVSLSAEENDVIRVKAICSKGGSLATEMTVPVDEEEKAENKKDDKAEVENKEDSMTKKEEVNEPVPEMRDSDY